MKIKSFDYFEQKNMDSNFASLLKSLAPFTDQELASASVCFREVKLKKDKYFSKAGRVSENIAFVKTGILRSFYNINDKEVTTFFAQPGSIAVAMLSFLQKRPAIENIQTLSDASLLVIHRDDLNRLYESSCKWQEVGRKLVEHYYVILEQRSIALQSKSAVEKYNYFLENYPLVNQLVPQYQIASFLGITPYTLSRIRKKII